MRRQSFLVQLSCIIQGFLATLLLVAPARGADYDESTLADFSGTPASPTTIQLDAGANVVAGSAGAGDFDLLHFSIPIGSALESLTLSSYINPFNAVSFIGLSSGAVWQAGLDFDVDPTKLLGWNHIAATGSSGIGSDLLIDMSVAPFTPGFARPLPPGDYTLLVQDTDNVVSYALTFNLASTTLLGDFNGDQTVDAADLEKWKGDFGIDDGSDADGDQDSDGDDFLIWQRQFAPAAATSAIPEPATHGMLVWIALATSSIIRATEINKRTEEPTAL
jgi:hypothetical protein